MVTTGLSLAILTGAGFLLLYQKLPRKIKRFMQKHVLLTDAVACLLTYLLFGTTLVALFAAAWLGVIVSILLAVMKNAGAERAISQAMSKVGELKDQFMAWLEGKFPPQVEEIELEEPIVSRR